MAKQFLFIMDPIEQSNPYKDTTIALIETALMQQTSVFICNACDCFVQETTPLAHVTQVMGCHTQTPDFYQLGLTTTLQFKDFDTVFLRKDPPFDIDYLNLTYLLSLAADQGACVVNHPTAVRNYNEKMASLYFPKHISPHLVTSDFSLIQSFLAQQQDIVIKPLDGMGGQGIFRFQYGDGNLAAAVELLTHQGQSLIMAQKALPVAESGDKRIFIIHGQVQPYALARYPAKGQTRANLAANGSGQVIKLTDEEYHQAQMIAPVLHQQGLDLVGLDMIDGYITEINVTSPTCFQEIKQATGYDMAQLFLEIYLAS